MASVVLAPRFGLEHLGTPGRFGVAAGDPGVAVALRTDRALATVTMRKGQGSALARRVEEAFGLAPPATPRRVATGPIAFAWTGPGQWLASHAGMDGRSFEIRLRQGLADLASVSDQSDARLLVRVAGARARDALGKGVMVDLHPRAFGPGDVAVTSVAHVGVQLWQLDDVPTYEFAIPRSFSASFWHWLMASAAEFGVTVE